MTSSVTVCAMPLLDPAAGRINIDVAYGLTVAQIISEVLPGATDDMLARARIWLVSSAGETVLSVRRYWTRIRPRPGVRVVIRLVPGDSDMLRSALMIAVSVGASALGQLWVGPAIMSATGSALLGNIGAAAFAAGVSMAGGMLINAMIPMETGKTEKPTFSISSFQNTASPDGPVPSILGRHRIAPFFAAPSYSEIVGDQHYIRALFVLGYGPLDVSDLRLKDTPISDYKDIVYEVRDGSNADPQTLYPTQVIEESVGAELRRDRLRDDAGEPVGVGPTVPVVRLSAGDATEGNVIINFPTGLAKAGDDGDLESHSINVLIRQRHETGGSWQTVTELNVTAAQREPFYRSYRWTFPARGRWQVEVTRLTSEPTNPRINDRSAWASLQSFRPEYPINFGKNVALVAMRIRATYQLNGALDTFNCIVERKIPDYDVVTGTWITRKTRNPASIFRHVLQGAENAFPELDSALELDLIKDWHSFCRAKGFKYDRIHDFEGSLWQVLTDVARAGRASPRHDGRRWGVVIDRPSTAVVAHVNPRNSRDFTWSRNYIEPPHAFRVQFLDETSDYQTRERIVRFPGYAGPITITEALTLPGKTDPVEIWRETRRRQYEVIHRPDQFRAIQDGAVRTATRGDLVKASYDTLDRTLFAHRVTAVRGQLITLDGWVKMGFGKNYAIRFFRQSGAGDAAVFVSALRNVVHFVGETDTIALDGEGGVPAIGEILQFGIAGQESVDVVVAGTESGEGMTTVLTMLASAPIIDTLTDAEIVPEWNGRVGSEQGLDVTVPAVPSVIGIMTHYPEQGGDADGLTVLLSPGSGNLAQLATFSVIHRLAGAATWSSPIVVPAGDGGLVVPGYTGGQTVQMQRMATSRQGYSSAWSDVFVGVLKAPANAPAPITSATVLPGLGSALITFATPSGPNLASVLIFRGPSSNIADAAPVAALPVVASASYSHTDGDATRPDLIVNGTFDTGAGWSLGASWSVTGGKASRSSGVSSHILQTRTLLAGSAYRIAFDVAFATGNIRARFTGGTTVNSPNLRTSGGHYLDRLVALTGNSGLSFNANIDFAGELDNVVMFEESPTSIPQGQHYYFLRSVNSDGRGGEALVLGPIEII